MWRVAAVVLCLSAWAFGGEAEPVRRHVIALMGGQADPENEDIVHSLLEMPLNHLGMVVYRHYIENGPPPREWLEDARAVLTFFSDDTKPEPWLWPWLEKEVRAHKLRVIHFNDFGPLEGKKLAPWLARFGLYYDDDFVDGPFAIEIEYFDEKACNYEASARSIANHRGPRSEDALSIRLPGTT